MSRSQAKRACRRKHSPKVAGIFGGVVERANGSGDLVAGQRQLFDVRRLEMRGQLSIIEEQHDS
jgi:hypothetical protein